MRKALGEVADLALEHSVVLLRQQAKVVAHTEQSLEQFLRLADAAREGVVVRKPEAACQECALGTRQSVGAVLGTVTKNEAVLEERPRDGGHGALHARILCWQEAHVRYEQHA